MKVFISHSGERSKALALRIEWFLRNLIPATDSFISTGIEKGSRWETDIAEALSATNVGIVCLTRENLNSRWILFESGALSKQLDGRVATLLLDVKADDVKPPLSQFQHTDTEEKAVWDLVAMINKRVGESGEKPRREDDLKETFTRFWPDLYQTIRELREKPIGPSAPPREVPDILSELLSIARANAQQRWVEEKTLKMLHLIYRGLFGEAAPDLKTLRQLVESDAVPSIAWIASSAKMFAPSLAHASTAPTGPSAMRTAATTSHEPESSSESRHDSPAPDSASSKRKRRPR